MALHIPDTTKKIRPSQEKRWHQILADSEPVSRRLYQLLRSLEQEYGAERIRVPCLLALGAQFFHMMPDDKDARLYLENMARQIARLSSTQDKGLGVAD